MKIIALFAAALLIASQAFAANITITVSDELVDAYASHRGWTAQVLDENENLISNPKTKISYLKDKLGADLESIAEEVLVKPQADAAAKTWRDANTSKVSPTVN